MKKYCLLSLGLLVCLTLTGCINIYTTDQKEEGTQPAATPSATAAAETPKATPTPEVTDTASFGTLTPASANGIGISRNFDIAASSTLAPMAGISYGPENLKDDDASTAWVEGVSDSGIGQSLTVFPHETINLKGFMILNGYGKNDKAFAENGRVARMSVYQPGGNRLCTLELVNLAAPQYFIFPETVRVTADASLEFIIEDTYAGPQDGEHDTALTELALLY